MRTLASTVKRYPGTQSKATRGASVARLLAGAWRGSPAPPASSAQELNEISNLLLTSGAAGLAWHRIRGSALGRGPVADQLHQAYRRDTLYAALQHRSLKQIIPLLRRSGVEPLLVKGWAIARYYPEPGLRPYIDLDLCVAQDQYADAMRVLSLPEADGCNVDLHAGFGKFHDSRADEIFERSRLASLDDLEVRVLSAEDDLRFLCIHLLRHGAVRPLWLCDIAILLEQRSGGFDWDRCLSGSQREVDWISCAIGLAHQLLGVDVERTPVAHRARNLPGWLAPTVLQSWGMPLPTLPQIKALLRQPASLLRSLPREMRRHWPNPIEATMTLEGPFNRLPRLPFQVGHVLSRTAALVAQVLGDSRNAAQHGS